MSERQDPQIVVLTGGTLKGQTLPLASRELVIGSWQDADLVITDPDVSERHALVTTDADLTVTISDLKSTSGTFVNGERLDGPRILVDGDIIMFASVRARFEAGSPGTGERNSDPDGHRPTVTPSAHDTFTVSGSVVSPSLPGVANLNVNLLDKNVGSEDTKLASTNTAADGSFTLTAEISADYLRQHQKQAPDLQAQACTGNTVLASSDVMWSSPNATSGLTIELPAGAGGVPSEFETLSTDLAAVYAGGLGALEESDSRQDLTYLANKTGWDARAVAMAALADQLATQSAHSNGAATQPAIRPELYYALLRAGLPASADALHQTDPATVQAIWTQATADAVIPPALADGIPAALQAFGAIGAERLLTLPSTAGLSTLGEMLAPVLPDPAQQQQFAQLYSSFGADPTALWPAVEKAFGGDTAVRLQLAGQLLTLTLDNGPLTQTLLSGRGDALRPLAGTADLVGQRLYESSAWTPLIGDAIPPAVPGVSSAERAGNYAAVLAAQVRLSYPTAVLADQVSRAVIPLAADAQRTAVADFLTTNNGAFEIGGEPIEAFLARTSVTAPTEVVSEIKRLQRVYQITPDDTSLTALLRHQLDSAYAVTRYDATAFQRTFADELGGPAQALAIHARARQVFSTVLNVAVEYLKTRVMPQLGGAASILRFPPQGSPPASPVMAYATLEDLFGSLDYCNCSDCGSILSPAAYLVDLLHYLDQPAPTAGDDPQTVLLERRPDLQYLPLTCANTNTAMPYIDIVNELLEYMVANNLSIAGYQGHDTSDHVSSAELIASPQYVNDAAYAALRDSFFPPPLPFNRPLELLRRHLQKLRLDLPDAMATLRASDVPTDRSTPTSYGFLDILFEELQISREEQRLFTDPQLELGDLYGLSAASALATLQSSSLQDLSRRLAVSYDDLVAIVQTQWVNPNAALISLAAELNTSIGELQKLHADPANEAAAFTASLPAGLDATTYGGSTPDDSAAIVAWVVAQYPRLAAMITIVNESGNPDDCSGAVMQLRYADPSAQQNLLSATDFIKLIRFIRLWRKLAAVTGQDDDAAAIADTDAILAALYPAVDVPANTNDTTHDAANRVLLDHGFAALLGRLGALMRVRDALSLSGDDQLAELLTCWGQIGTTGQDSLYRRSFLTPALLARDPGAQLATVAGTVSIGDKLTTAINVPIVQAQITHTVAAGEDSTAVAAAIAHAINTSAAIDPATVAPATPAGVPIGQRFHAASQGAVITIEAGFVVTASLSAGASETYSATATSPVAHTTTVGGAATVGDTLTTTINGLAIPCLVRAGDTPTTIAAGIAAAINATSAADPYSGLPLCDLLVASATGPTVTIIAANAGAPFSLACNLQPASAGGYTVGTTIAPGWTAAIGGTVAAGDILVTTIDGTAIDTTAAAAVASPSELATAVAAAINTSTATDPATRQPLNTVIHAVSTADVVLISAVDPARVLAVTCAVTHGAESYVAQGPNPQSTTATVTGSIPSGVTLTTTINAVAVPVTISSPSAPAAVATMIAAAVNATTSPDPSSGLPLSAVIHAQSSGGAVTITGTAAGVAFTVETSVSAGGYTAGQAVPPFSDGGTGAYLTDPTQTLFGHQPTICAACKITAAEFVLIAQALDFTATTPLTLDNVSAVFRHGWMAHTLALSVLEFEALRMLTGLDPFAPLDPATTQPAEPPVLRLIRLLTQASEAGLDTAQMLYLIWNRDISGTSAPTLGTVAQLATALRAAFAGVDAAFALQDDPDGKIAQSLMALVYGNPATDFFFGLLGGTFTRTVPYAAPAGTSELPAPVIAAADGRLSYDALRLELIFAGVLDPGTAAAIEASIPAGSDPALAGKIGALATVCQQAVGAFFATYPELHPLYATFASSSAPIQQRRTELLANFLPILQSGRKREQALATITSTAATVPAIAGALLSNPVVLAADGEPSLAAVSDLLALGSPGLSAEVFLGNDPSQPADQTLDAVAVIAYTRTATISGTATPGDVLTTTVNGVAVVHAVTPDETTLAALADGLVATLGAATATDPQTQLPINRVISATVSASAPTSVTIMLAGRDPSGATSAFTLGCATSAGATETYAAGTTLPGPGTAPIAIEFNGYITAPQSGPYDLQLVADAGANVSVELDGTPIPLTHTAGLWANATEVTLIAGSLTPVVIRATSLESTLSISWRSLGLGWQPIPGEFLYAQRLMDHLTATYVRFLKAAALADALTLNPPEIAELSAAATFAVTTTTSAKLAAGAVTITPASITNIRAGTKLRIGAGATAEEVTVANAGATSFDTTLTASHDGTLSPVPIVSVTTPATGRGWLGWLTATATNPDPLSAAELATAASLTGVLSDALAFARIKRALSPSDDRLLHIVQNPAALLPSGQLALLSLTGWSSESLDALLVRFFGSADPGSLTAIDNLARVYDAYTVIHASGLPAASLLAAITNAPLPSTVGALEAAVRGRYSQSAWLTVLGPISDGARIAQRDALVAYVLQRLGDIYAAAQVRALTSAQATTGATQIVLSSAAGVSAGMLVSGPGIAAGSAVAALAGTTVTLSEPVTWSIQSGSPLTFSPADQVPIDTADRLYELLLIDAETQPPVLTSRIRLALSTVQLFVERVIRNLEPRVAPADIDTSRWTWMKRYRVWQANREVFLWPENWLYPELRDNQSPLFGEAVSGLLQGDITDDSATSAYLDYLGGLEHVAKLEAAGIFYQPGDATTDETVRVVSRSSGAHRKHYVRALTGGSWTPWSEAQIDCQDMPVTPIVWNGRQFVFWLKIVKSGVQGPPAPSGLPKKATPVSAFTLSNTQALTKANQAANQVAIGAVLCWSEYVNGKWQPTKSSDLDRPTNLSSVLGNFDPTGPNSFEASARDLLRIVPATYGGHEVSIPPGSLILTVLQEGLVRTRFPFLEFPGFCGGFLLHNTHSLPTRLDDIALPSLLFGGLTIGLITEMVPLTDALDSFAPSRTMTPLKPSTGEASADTFAIDYANSFGDTPTFHNEVLGFSWLPRYVQPQPGLSDAWFTPFIYEDRRRLFYVTTDERVTRIPLHQGFGLGHHHVPIDGRRLKIPPLIVASGPRQPAPGDPVTAATSDGADNHVLTQYPTLRAALPLTQSVTFNGRVILPTSSAPATANRDAQGA